MRKMILMIAFLFSLGVQVVYAQTTISGTVTDGQGNPVPGASVRVKGYSDIGSISDIEGKYTLNVPADASTLVFSFVGMKATEVEINGQTVINISIEPDEVGINEVVVIAYGTKTKRELTGAVTSIDSETIGNQIAVSPLRAIQGTAAGVNVITTGGQPGENPSIRIRGIGSVNAEAEPLIILDGVVFSGNINSISGDQIESINILKDASASSLYGSRASNGVLLITTKNGKYGNKGSKVTLNSKFGYSSPAVKTYELVRSEDYMKYTWEALKNTELYVNGETAQDAAQLATDNLISHLQYNPYNVADPVGTDGQIVSGASLLWDTDWYNELIRSDAFYNDASLGIEGGTENVSYYFNGSYLNQDGAVIESNFKRYAIRMNINAKLKSWLEIGTNSSYTSSTQNYPNQAGSSYTSGMQWVNSISSIYPVFQRDENGALITDAAGNYIYDFGNRQGLVNATRPLFGGGNAIASTKLDVIKYDRTSLFSSNYLKISFSKSLTFKTNVGYENYLYDYYTYDHYKYGSAAQVNGRVEQRRNRTETISFTNALNFNKKFGEHTVGADLISEVFNYKYDYLQAQATGYLPDVTVLAGSTTPESVNGYINEERLVSILGRVNYDYKSKYYIDFSLRRDASTKFKEGDRWGTFYSVGANWILSEESFMEGLSKTISLLKIRSSYGELGNNRGLGGYFPYLSSYSTGWNNNENTGIRLGRRADANISWEKSALFNIAIDLSLFNNRINSTIEYYNKKSIDLIFDKPLPLSTGDNYITTNIGSMTNKGFEFSINTVNIHTETLYWTTSFNIATNINELTELPQEEILVGSKKYMIGKSVYDFFIEEYAGVNPDNGQAMWYMDEQQVDGNGDPVFDSNGDPVLTGNKVTTEDYADADRYYQGSALPDVTGGISTFISYRNFDLNVLFNYSFGGKILDNDYQGLMTSLERPGAQISTDIANRWQEPGDITDVPRLSASNNDYNARSTRFLFDNDYIRLKALTFGYNLPSSLLSRIKIDKCRVYIQADNIWTYQTHKGIDPEQNFGGTTDQRSNMMKTITFGLNVEF